MKKIITSIVVGVLLAGWFTYRHYEFREVTSYDGGGAGYECSRPITVKLHWEKVGHMSGFSYGFLYLPVNPDEAKLFCHGTWIEEYKGKITVLQKPEVLDLISRYEYKEVSVKALKFELIKSEGFVDRLLPQYKGREIGCIIILETPHEKMVFLEDEHLETFEQMDYKIFDRQLDQASSADKRLFMENLR